MVDAGNGEHGNKGSAVNGAAQNAEIVVPEGGADDAGQQYNDTKSTADNMGNHIHQLFSAGVIGESAVGQFGSFHGKYLA